MSDPKQEPVTTPLVEKWSAQWDDNGYWYIEPLGITGNGLRGDSGDCLERSRAMLIAQAPRMYEVLAALVTLCDEPDPSPDESLAMGLVRLLPEARAVLAAARGESQ